MNKEQAIVLYNALNAFQSSGYQFTIELHDKDLLPFTVKAEDDRLLIMRDDHLLMTIIAKQDVNSIGQIIFHTEEKEINLLESTMDEMRQIMRDERL